MAPPVRYIEKTHDYYRRSGYPKPYKYARFDTTPFTPLGLSEALQVRPF